jgi:hypothetical protein
MKVKAKCRNCGIKIVMKANEDKDILYEEIRRNGWIRMPSRGRWYCPDCIHLMAWYIRPYDILNELDKARQTIEKPSKVGVSVRSGVKTGA